MTSELPEEMLDPDAPPGAPPQMQSRAAPVWCAHGVRWVHTEVGYVADDAMAGPHVGHRDPAQDVGSIPCQPTYASLETWQRLMSAREVEAERNRNRPKGWLGL
jgi:hypothetical protein